MADKKIRFKINAERTATPAQITVNGKTVTIPNNIEVELDEGFYEVAVNGGYDVELIDGETDVAANHKAREQASDPTLPAGGVNVVDAATASEDAAQVAELPQGAADASAPDAGGGNGDGVQKFDHDGGGNPGGSAPKEPVSLTGKTTADLEQIAKNEGVDLTDAKTNADRVKAIEEARAAKA